MITAGTEFTDVAVPLIYMAAGLQGEIDRRYVYTHNGGTHSTHPRKPCSTNRI